MSGIAGVIRFDGGPGEGSLVEAMTSLMSHRGPDGIRHWQGEGAALGQCMLRTTPESLEEIQPLLNDDESVVLVMDGRVDNWEELRAELLQHGARLRTRADAELVLRAYEQWGKDCVNHIDGDFAVVIWNTRTREAFCARDRFGMKPFIYHFDGKVFSFASEVRPVLSLPWVKQEFNEGLVAEFLAAEWHTLDETFWVDVMRLPPNSRMTVSHKGKSIDTYWQPDLTMPNPLWSDEEYIASYREILFDAVRRLSRSHKPLACEVSGGLDSSALFAVAEHLRRDGKLPTPGLQGYTLKFEGETAANELAYARAVGEYLNHTILEVEPTYKSLDWYQNKARREAEFPGYPNSIMGIGIREEVVRRDCRALMSGVGGDEILTGNKSYYADLLGNWQVKKFLRYLLFDVREQGVLKPTRSIAQFVIFPHLPARLQDWVRQIAQYLGDTEQTTFPELLQPQLLTELKSRRMGARKNPNLTSNAMQHKFLYAKFFNSYNVLARGIEESQASYARLELRHPFLSRSVVESSFRIPDYMRFPGATTKLLHRQALRGLLPEKVTKRSDKAEFSETYQPYYSNILKKIDENSSSSRSKHWIEYGAEEQYMQSVTSSGVKGIPFYVVWTLFGCAAII